MKIYEIGTGYTSIPAQMGAATEIVVEELVKAFQKQSADVELLDIQAAHRPVHTLPITEVKVPRSFTSTDVQLGLLHKLKRVVYSISLAMKLRKILKNTDEDVILHFHNQYNLFFFYKLVSAKLRTKAKVAYTVHSYIWAGEWKDIEATVEKRYFQEIDCVRHADYVLSLNDLTTRHFVEHLGVPAERIFKIKNGVNTGIYSPLSNTEIDAFRKAIDLEGQKVILQVGSVCDRKNQLGAVQLLRDYLKQHPNVSYLYAGGIIDQDYQAEIQRFAAESGIASQVRYLGELQPGVELNKYYNIADATIFPSKQESFGLVIIESLSAGTPVLCSCKPIFSIDQGCLVYDSESSFITFLEHCFSRAIPAEHIREEAIKHYGWDRIAQDHIIIWSAQENNT